MSVCTYYFHTLPLCLWCSYI